MALRDPGAPRRNPFFAVDDTGPAMGRVADQSRPGETGPDEPLRGAPDDPLFGAPGSTVGPVLGALHEAGPEAVEHLVNAAHELTLAVKVVVDAFERTLADQRAVFAAENARAGAGFDEIDLDDDPFASPSRPRPRVREAGERAPRVQNIHIE